MKLMIASDIHGSLYWCRRLMEAWKEEKPRKLLLLGDLLYHGPRNDLPRDYAPKEVIAQLNAIKEHLLCVRGNCEAEVDQMVLEFPVLTESLLFFLDERMVYATHGHIFGRQHPPMLSRGDILLHGHTHIQAMEDTENFIYLNPGSVSIPKEGNDHSYMVYEDGIFTIKSLTDGKEISRLKL